MQCLIISTGKKTHPQATSLYRASRVAGKTMLATSFIKVLQKDGEQLTGKMGKIDAAALNKKDVQQVVRKITGGCLIIERAGDIDRSIAAKLSF